MVDSEWQIKTIHHSLNTIKPYNMSKIIAVTGKGGTGKSTVASLIIRALIADKANSVLAVDADPNSTLGEMLGLKVENTMSSICEEMLDKKEDIPAGMTKEQYLKYKIEESLTEKNNLTLLTMGRPEGPGCYCYANNLLRGIVKDLTDDYKFTVIDNEAGMEHISRKTARSIDVLFIVSDFSIIGIKSAARIYNLAKDIGIKVGKSFLIINKVKSPISSLEKEINCSGIPLAAALPFSDDIERISIDSKSLLSLQSNLEVVKLIDSVVKKSVI